MTWEGLIRLRLSKKRPRGTGYLWLSQSALWLQLHSESAFYLGHPVHVKLMPMVTNSFDCWKTLSSTCAWGRSQFFSNFPVFIGTLDIIENITNLFFWFVFALAPSISSKDITNLFLWFIFASASLISSKDISNLFLWFVFAPHFRETLFPRLPPLKSRQLVMRVEKSLKNIPTKFQMMKMFLLIGLHKNNSQALT